ncbi:MAG: hypothetical protein M3N46_11775 [Actinomycetota bacterium]|nr:hypothetical protein [Actinomycetota bacterium]
MDAHYDYISQENRYGLGVDTDSGKHFLAIPVTIGVADYNEYYEVTDVVFTHYLADPASALDFAEECRLREHDELLILKPGWNRGIPI